MLFEERLDTFPRSRWGFSRLSSDESSFLILNTKKQQQIKTQKLYPRFVDVCGAVHSGDVSKNSIVQRNRVKSNFMKSHLVLCAPKQRHVTEVQPRQEFPIN